MKVLEEPALLEAIMDARGQIDFLWQFFVTVHIAIFALLFIYGNAVERLNWPARILSLLGVAGFEWINGNALANAYMMLDAMHDQYRWSFGQVERFHAAFYEQFVLARYDTRPMMVVMTHTTALVVVVLAFLSQRILQSRQSAADQARQIGGGVDPRGF